VKPGAFSAAPQPRGVQMVTRDDVESFLLRMEEDAEEVEPGMWVLGSDRGNVVVHYSPPLLILRAKVLEVPVDDAHSRNLFRKLLELNATDLIHGAYGIEEQDVILSDTLELESVDFAALQATLESIQLALASHLDAIAAAANVEF
jgi:hypothetical protein